MNATILDQFRLTVQDKKLGLYGIVIYKKGDGAVSHRWRSNERVCIFSGSKTFTAIAVGICKDEGRLDLYDKVQDFFPEYKSISVEDSAEMTVRDLLHMASGKGAFLFSVDEQTLYTVDWAELFFKEPQVNKPGERFVYSDACTYMLSRIVERVSGNILRDYLLPRLFAPLGIQNPQWHTCPGGHTIGATELFLTTEEYSRLGILMINDGVYGDKRIIGSKYINDAVTDIIENGSNGGDPENTAGYGYQIRLCSRQGIYRADGMYGQLCIVIPDKEAVVTVTAHEEAAKNDIIRAIYTDILPQL